MALPYATENQLKEISKRIKNIIENKQDKLIEGENISIKDNVISARSPIKVYDWELEEDEATGNIYVKDPDAYNSIEKLISENALINLYFPDEDFESGKIYLGHFFMSYSWGDRDQTAIDLGYLAGNTGNIAAGGSPNDIYHIYLMGDEDKQKLKYNLVKVETGGSSYTPLELTMTLVNDTPTVELTKEQYDTLIDAINNKEPIIAWATYTNNSTLRLPIALPTKMSIGEQSIYAGVASYVSALLIDMSYNWVLLKNEEDNQTTYSLFLTQLTNFSKDWGLYSETELGSGFCFGNGGNLETQGSKIYVSKFNDIPIIDYGRVPLNAYTDTINNKNILQFSTLSPEINNYYAPTTINETSTPKILQSKNSQMEWVDLPTSDTAVIILTPEQVQSLSQFQITFTQEQATLLEKATSFKFYYADNEIAHGQCGKIALGVNTLYGLLIIVGGNIYLGQSEFGVLTNYTQKIFIKSVNSIKIVTDKDIFVSDSTIQIGFEEFLGDGTILNSKYIYFDTINNNPILHTKNTDVKNYDLGKSINLFGKHSILVPNSSNDTNIDLYNHFIKITGTKDNTQVIARFTIQSSNNLAVDTPEKLVTLLGNEFELGCNGIYGNYNITGLKKTADGALNIIYNNGGAENLLSTTGITLTIEDNVKNI